MEQKIASLTNIAIIVVIIMVFVLVTKDSYPELIETSKRSLFDFVSGD